MLERLHCRVLPYIEADGPWNMAADETLLETAMAGLASFRLYGWTEATVSLGYFQPSQLRAHHARLAVLPWVRRPTGGQALVHHHELTYALALPAGLPWQTPQPISSWQHYMHRVIATALADVGVGLSALPADAERPFDGLLCFQHPTAGDLMSGVHKVVGSAQRRRRGALLQHGGILLAASPHTPELPGIHELAGNPVSVLELSETLLARLREDTGWDLTPARWSDDEKGRLEDLLTTRYARPEWNEKR